MALGMLVSLGVLVALLTLVDLNTTWRALRDADFRFVALALVALLLGLLARSLAWRALLQEQVDYVSLFFVLNIGYLLNSLISRLGDVGRALVLSGRPTVSFWQALSTILVERAFDLLITVGMVLVTLPLVVGADWVRPVALSLGGGVLLALLLLHLLARYRQSALRLFERLTARFPRLERVGQHTLTHFFEGLQALVEPWRFVQVFFWLLLAWLCIVTEYYLLLFAFLPEAHFYWAMFGVGVVALSVVVPSSPGFVGVVEAAVVGAFSLFGVEPAVGLAYAVTAHGLYLAVTAVLGGWGLGREGESLRHLIARVRRRLKSGAATT